LRFAEHRPRRTACLPPIPVLGGARGAFDVAFVLPRSSRISSGRNYDSVRSVVVFVWSHCPPSIVVARNMRRARRKVCFGTRARPVVARPSPTTSCCGDYYFTRYAYHVGGTFTRGLRDIFKTVPVRRVEIPVQSPVFRASIASTNGLVSAGRASYNAINSTRVSRPRTGITTRGRSPSLAASVCRFRRQFKTYATC